MVAKMMVSIVVRGNGSIGYTIQSARGVLLGGGGTNPKNPPKDPIRTICRSVERALKAKLAKR